MNRRLLFANPHTAFGVYVMTKRRNMNRRCCLPIRTQLSAYTDAYTRAQ